MVGGGAASATAKKKTPVAGDKRAKGPASSAAKKKTPVASGKRAKAKGSSSTAPAKKKPYYREYSSDDDYSEPSETESEGPPESDPVRLRLDVAYNDIVVHIKDMMNKLMEFVDRRLALARTKINKDLAEKDEIERMKRNKKGGGRK